MKKTAKSSKMVRANKRKAKLKAKHRRQRARATGSTRLAGLYAGAFWEPGNPALISLPGPAWPVAA
jgi:hypothetical protein